MREWPAEVTEVDKPSDIELSLPGPYPMWSSLQPAVQSQDLRHLTPILLVTKQESSVSLR
jgi:hypothetical protein